MLSTENKVLMLYRNNRPNKNKWNGLGGKIEEGEEHRDSVIRELKEEADIDLSVADDLKYAGIVSWDVTSPGEHYLGGMHAYIAEFNDPKVIFEPRVTREGKLEWLDLEWVQKPDNPGVVENISRFLPSMVVGIEPAQYHCVYVDEKLIDFKTLPL